MTKPLFEFIPPASKFVDLPSSFAMKRGGRLSGGRVAYETWGTPSPLGDNVVLILTGLSPDTHAASHPDDPRPGWWESMVGPGKPIDTDYWHVICVNSLGSCKGSTGPASIHPETGQPYRLDFPALSIEDIADAAAVTVRAIGIEKLACVIGTSMGGMTSLALLLRHPGLARSLINISGARSAQAFSIAIRSLQREAIRRDPWWNKGRYDETCYPEAGMATARKLGIISYRCPLEWEERFGRRLSKTSPTDADDFELEFEVESYLQGHAHRFLRNYDPNCYLYLSRAMDWFDVEETTVCSVQTALRQTELGRALIMGVEGDILFPLRQQRQIADELRSAGVETQFLPLDSPHGHDSFLVDVGRFGPPVKKFLSDLPIPSFRPATPSNDAPCRPIFYAPPIWGGELATAPPRTDSPRSHQ